MKKQSMHLKLFGYITYGLFTWVPISVLAESGNTNAELWKALQEGGKVVLMRHAPVEKGSNSGDPLVRDPSCENEKNVSKTGERNAQLLGMKFRDYAVPVSFVRHSPFCRTAKTAQLIFGNSKPADYLSLLETLSPEEAAQQTQNLTGVIESFKDEGNLVLITHEPNINAISFEVIKHLDFLVIDPVADDEFEELGVVRFLELE